MSLIDYLKIYFLALPVYLGIDLFWIGVVSKKFYDSAFKPFERTLNFLPAILVYLLIPIGLLIFTYPKANGNPTQGFIQGAIFGFIAYGVYDLTNWATLAKWSLKMTIVDMLWGAFICGLMTAIMVAIGKRIL